MTPSKDASLALPSAHYPPLLPILHRQPHHPRCPIHPIPDSLTTFYTSPLPPTSRRVTYTCDDPSPCPCPPFLRVFPINHNRRSVGRSERVCIRNHLLLLIASSSLSQRSVVSGSGVRNERGQSRSRWAVYDDVGRFFGTDQAQRRVPRLVADVTLAYELNRTLLSSCGRGCR